MKIYIGTSGDVGLPIKYRNLTLDVSSAVASLDFDLIYKGNIDGICGNIFRTFRFRGNNVSAITDLKHLDDIKDLEIEDYEVCKSSMEVTHKIYKNADVLLFVPGGISTVSEFISILEEERNTGLNKKIILYNYEDYFSDILKFLRNGYKEGFMHEDDLKLINVVNNIDSLNKYLTDIKESER